MNSTKLEAFNQVIMRGVQDLTESFRGVCDNQCPSGETGLMAGAHQTMYDRDDLTGYVMNDTEYAKYVHWGTKPYYIKIIPYHMTKEDRQALGARAVVIGGELMAPVFIGWVKKVLGFGRGKLSMYRSLPSVITLDNYNSPPPVSAQTSIRGELEAYVIAWAIHKHVRKYGFEKNPWMLNSYYMMIQSNDYIQRAFPDFKVVMA
jgi:hypothetical protein